MTVTISVPVRLRVDSDALAGRSDEIDIALASAMSRAIASSRKLVLDKAGQGVDIQYDAPTISWRGPGVGNLLPDEKAGFEDRVGQVVDSSASSIKAAGTPVVKKVKPSTRPWFVVKTTRFRCTLDEFFTFTSSLPGESDDLRTIYLEMLKELHWGTLWLVQAKVPYIVKDLAQEVFWRATELSKVREDQQLYAGYTTSDSKLKELADVDRTKTIKSFPELRRHNAGLIFGQGQEALLKARTRIFFAMMILPRIRLSEIAYYGEELTVDLTIADLDGYINPQSFELLFAAPWDTFVAEYGKQAVKYHILPVYPMRRVPYATMRYFVDLDLASQVPSESAFFGSLRLLNRERISSIPTAVRPTVEAISDATTLALPSSAEEGTWEEEWIGAYLYTILQPTQEERDTARYRPQARWLASQVPGLLENDPIILSGRIPMGDFVRNLPDGKAMEYFLDELKTRGLYEAFIGWIESADNWEMHERLIRLTLETRFASDVRFLKTIELINSRRLSRSKHSFHITSQYKEMWVHQESDVIVRVGAPGNFDIVGFVHSDYINEEEQQRIRPEKLKEFDALLFKAAWELFGEIANGKDTNEYTEEEFAHKVLERVAKGIGEEKLQKEYLYTADVERSCRILDIRRRDEILDLYSITFEMVERTDDGPWITVPNSRGTLVDGEFEGMLDWWPRLKGFAFITAFSKVVAFGATLVIAWEIGVIGAMVELAGGATAVTISIAISELIYIFTADKLTIGGFIEHAFYGYLGALGMRFLPIGGIIGKYFATKIGTASILRTITGMLVERMAIGIVVGAPTGALLTLGQGIVNVMFKRGEFPTLGDFLKGMAWGAVFGIGAEFAGPILRPVLQRLEGITSTLITDILPQLRAAGLSPTRWASLTSEMLGSMRRRFAEFMDEGIYTQIVDGLRSRYTQITEALSAEGLTSFGRRVIAGRVFELAELNLNATARNGLEKFVTHGAPQIEADALLTFVNALAKDPTRAQRFLQAMNGLDNSVITTLGKQGQLVALSNSPAALGFIERYGGTQAGELILGAFRGSIAQLEEFLTRISRFSSFEDQVLALISGPNAAATWEGMILSLEATGRLPGTPAVAPPTRSSTLLQAQQAGFLRTQAAAVRAQAQALRAQATALDTKAANTQSYNPTRAAKLKTQADGQRSQATALDSEAARLEAEALEFENGRLTAIEQITDAEIDALIAQIDTQAVSATWIRVALDAAERNPALLSRLLRPALTSRTGNRVVFRVEGGGSQDLIKIDAAGNVTLTRKTLNLNFGTPERAVEFIREHRPTGQVKVFEVYEDYFQSLRSGASVERGLPVRLNEVDPAGNVIGQLDPPPNIADVVQDVPRLVDVRFAEDQLQVLESVVPELQQFVVPGSGRTITFQSLGTGTPPPTTR